RQVLHGRFAPREVVVSQPTLRICRRNDGTWNLQGLIADPWPGPMIENPPPIVIRNGTIELVCDLDGEDDAAIAEGPTTVRQGIAQEAARQSTPSKSPSPEPARSLLNQGVAIL